MNNSPIDVLLQIPVPRVEAAPAGVRARDESSEFDDHFRKASNPDSPPTAAAQSSRDSNAPRDAAPQKPATHSNQASQASNETPPASDSPSTDDEQAKSTDSEDNDDATAEDAVAIVAAVAAEEAAVSEPNVLDGDEVHVAAKSNENVVATRADDEQRPRAKDAKSAARVNPAAPAESPSKPVAPQGYDDEQSAAKALEESRDPKQQPSTANEQKSDANVNPVDASQPPAETADSTHGTADKSRRADKSVGHTKSNAPAAQPAVTTSATAVEKISTTKKNTVESTGEPAARKSDKKTGPRATATPADASAAPTERPAAIAASANTPVAPAAQPSQPVAAQVAASATANSAPKPQDAQPASKPGFLSPFARLERGAHAARGANPSAATDGPRHVDPARFVSRVARAIHTAQERGGPLQLRLSPPELGAMRLELSLSQGTLTASIETEHSSTRQLLIDNLPALRERLAEQSIKIERFDVDVRRDPSGNGQHTAPQDRGQAEHHDRRSGRNSAPRANSAAPAVDAPAPLRRNISNTSINVVA